MRFQLTTTGDYYPDDSDKEELESLGFRFVPVQGWQGQSLLFRMDMPEEGVEIEIDSIETLMGFVKKHGEIILSEGKIEIYDDYHE